MEARRWVFLHWERDQGLRRQPAGREGGTVMVGHSHVPTPHEGVGRSAENMYYQNTQQERKPVRNDFPK